MKEFGGARGMEDYMGASVNVHIPPSELMDCDPMNFGQIYRIGKKMTRGQTAGYRFVLSLASGPAFWVPQSTDVPWAIVAESAVVEEIQHGGVDQSWLLGVMQIVRSAKPNHNAKQLAAAFLTLSCLTAEQVAMWLQGVNLKAICEGGYRMSDIVPLAAAVAEKKLGLSTREVVAVA